jgi:hypothetical protein
MSEDAITTLSNLTMQIPSISGTSDGHAAATASSITMIALVFL